MQAATHHMHSPPITHHWFFLHRNVDREQIHTNTRDVGDVMKDCVYVFGAVEFHSEPKHSIRIHVMPPTIITFPGSAGTQSNILLGSHVTCTLAPLSAIHISRPGGHDKTDFCGAHFPESARRAVKPLCNRRGCRGTRCRTRRRDWVLVPGELRWLLGLRRRYRRWRLVQWLCSNV